MIKTNDFETSEESGWLKWGDKWICNDNTENYDNIDPLDGSGKSI